jgi:CBS domain-containing protein
MTAREIMTPNPTVVTQDESISRAACIMRDQAVGMLPVVTDEGSMTLVGLITDRDIVIQHVAGLCSSDCAVSAHMSKGDIATVDEDADAGTVLEVMQTRQVRRVPVTSGSGKLVGVIAQADIAVSDDITKEDVADTVKEISMP